MTKAQLVRKHAQVKAQMDLLEERTAKAKEMLDKMNSSADTTMKQEDKDAEKAKLVDALNKAKMNMERIKMHMQFFFPMMEVVASANELKKEERK